MRRGDRRWTQERGRKKWRKSLEKGKGREQREGHRRERLEREKG